MKQSGIDWEKRERELRARDKHRKADGLRCIVPLWRQGQFLPRTF